MQFNTDLFYVGGTKQPAFGKHQFIISTAEWQLWLSKVCEETRMPLVVNYKFPVKPTKRQVRKLRRAFRKEAKMWAESEWVTDPFDTYEANELPSKRMPVHELDANAWDWIAKETADLRSIMDKSASETL